MHDTIDYLKCDRLGDEIGDFILDALINLNLDELAYVSGLLGDVLDNTYYDLTHKKDWKR